MSRVLLARRAALAAALALVGCSGGADSLDPARSGRARGATTGRVVTVTIVAAEIAGHMPNGEQWDAGRRRGSGGAPLDRYLAAHPELATTAYVLGIPTTAPRAADEARASPAADPMVLVEIGPSVFRTPAQLHAFNPVWEFPFVFLVGERDGGVGASPSEIARIHVVDWDGPDAFDVIGTALIPVGELIARPLHRLGPFGGVVGLTLAVAVSEPASGEPAVTRLAVPGKPSWTDTGVVLVAGQRVLIEAADEVCTKGGERCSGPEGQRETSDYNLPGFAKLGHGALVGALGDTRFPVLRELSFVAPASGALRLGVNDEDYDNNRGSYAVRVVVEPIP